MRFPRTYSIAIQRLLKSKFTFLLLAICLTFYILSNRQTQQTSTKHPKPLQPDRSFPTDDFDKRFPEDEQDVGKASNTHAETVFKPGVIGNYEFRPNLTFEKERVGPGEQGIGAPRDGNTKGENALKYEYGFNVYVSDKISLNRSVKDTRHKECKYWHYPEYYDLPKASVVIIFRNEAWTTLMRTVYSVIIRSPPPLLKEIILVDDASDKEHLKGRLEKHMKSLNIKSKIIRNPTRQGLITTRTNGAKVAEGEVIIFLDCHCEVNVNWLPPLLAPIAKNNKIMTVPFVDGIDADNWEYRSAYGDQLFRGIFEWGFLYKETIVPAKEAARHEQKTEPFRSPTHAGGLLAIHRDWFKSLGWYDPGLEIWGGEQYELSFKVWQCGGEVLFVPCSRVGHVYRNAPTHAMGVAKASHPNFADHNHLRVAAVWMDEYIKYYYTIHPNLRSEKVSDVTDQIAIRNKLKCKPFKWFMEEIAYDIVKSFPLPPPNAQWGELRNKHRSEKCWDTMGSKPGNRQAIAVYSCHGQHGNQMFRLNVEGQLTSGEWCVKDMSDDEIRLTTCKKGTVNGLWQYSTDDLLLKYRNKCVALVDNETLRLEDCDSSSKDQQWTWKH